MFLVNFLGGFRVTPALLRHNDTFFSYADSIMPQFFFAVGFAYRLTFLRSLTNGDTAGARRRVWRRNLKLILLGAVVYLVPALLLALTREHPPVWTRFATDLLREELFQTLVHIGVTALWILPVIGARPWVQLLFAAGSAGLHLALSHWFYYDFVTRVAGIDGGVLGFLSWTIPMIAGSFACDICSKPGEPASALGPLLKWGAGLMLLGYLLIVPQPGNSAQRTLRSRSRFPADCTAVRLADTPGEPVDHEPARGQCDLPDLWCRAFAGVIRRLRLGL